MEIWNKLKRPPKEALKLIQGGRLKGMSDISPQWRYQVMTETFGPVGKNWWYEIVRTWTESTADGQISAFVEIKLFIEDMRPIPGIGGSMLYAKEKNGLYHSDECYKMALTDALGVALKLLGVAADIYAGLWDGSRYKEPAKPKGNYQETLKHISNVKTKDELKEIYSGLSSFTWTEDETVKLKYQISQKAESFVEIDNSDVVGSADRVKEMFKGEEKK
jgi:hypothetical protein